MLDIIIEVDEEKEKNIESDKQINLSSKDNVKSSFINIIFGPFLHKDLLTKLLILAIILNVL